MIEAARGNGATRALSGQRYGVSRQHDINKYTCDMYAHHYILSHAYTGAHVTYVMFLSRNIYGNDAL